MATGWENRCDNGRHLKKKFKKVGRGDISEVAQSDVCPTERGPKKIRRVRKKTKMGTLRNGRLDQGTFLPRARRPMGLSGALGALGAFAGGRPGAGSGALWICAILLLTLTWGAQANSAGEILNSSSNISYSHQASTNITNTDTDPLTIKCNAWNFKKDGPPLDLHFHQQFSNHWWVSLRRYCWQCDWKS